MSVQQQVIRELEDIPPESQEKILKLIRFLKNELLYLPKQENDKKNTQTLLALDSLAIDTGISDLAEQHDHYLYGVPKK